MSFVVDDTRLTEMSWHAVVGTGRGVAGIALTVSIIIAAIILNVFFHTQASGFLAKSLHARDEASMRALGIVVCAITAAVGFGVLYATWNSCNEYIGARLDQSAQLDDTWLQYTYRPLGFHDARTRFLVFAHVQDLNIAYDNNLDIIELHGLIYTKLCRDAQVEWPQSLSQMEQVDTFYIPNCFSPNLYEALRTT